MHPDEAGKQSQSLPIQDGISACYVELGCGKRPTEGAIARHEKPPNVAEASVIEYKATGINRQTLVNRMDIGVGCTSGSTWRPPGDGFYSFITSQKWRIPGAASGRGSLPGGGASAILIACESKQRQGRNNNGY